MEILYRISKPSGDACHIESVNRGPDFLLETGTRCGMFVSFTGFRFHVAVLQRDITGILLEEQ